MECKSAGGCVRVGSVVEERLVTDGRVVEAVALLKSALTPLAVLELPVVLLKSARSPSAVWRRLLYC